MKKNIIIAISIIMAVVVLTVFLPKGVFSGQEKSVFRIMAGEGSKEISASLEKNGYIWWGPAFRLYVLTRGISGNLQAGAYEISSSMSLFTIAEKFAAGDILKEKITIIEGWNLRDIGYYFENNGMFQTEEFWEMAGFPATDYSVSSDLPEPRNFSQDYAFLQDKPGNSGLEGYLFPDTYEINSGMGLEEIIKKMLNNFGEKLSPGLREEIEKQNKSIFEIVTMASLIEKEVISKEDKQIVSGILWKRLKSGVPLQVDATISYVTGIKSTKISIQDTQIDSPFNTYKYYGLPLGPICNPGIESVRAAIFPANSVYWYYLSTPEGETVFSRTLQEHNTAKAKYLK